MNLPEKYKAIVLPEYNPNFIRAMLSLKLSEKRLIEPKAGEVLVKMSASPCNPSDLAFMQGSYNIKKETPVVPGFEGTGVVVATGNHSGAESLMNKRVSCFTQHQGDGTWAEYF
ncbi:MAG: alcohol dehydrogenase catalytic domain-containing protein, partial [Bacteroidota bacterium]